MESLKLLFYLVPLYIGLQVIGLSFIEKILEGWVEASFVHQNSSMPSLMSFYTTTGNIFPPEIIKKRIANLIIFT